MPEAAVRRDLYRRGCGPEAKTHRAREGHRCQGTRPKCAASGMPSRVVAAWLAPCRPPSWAHSLNCESGTGVTNWITARDALQELHGYAKAGAYAGSRISGIGNLTLPSCGSKHVVDCGPLRCLPVSSGFCRRLAAQVEQTDPHRIGGRPSCGPHRCAQHAHRAQEGFEVVGEADDGDEAITQTLELKPDILLLDVRCRACPALRPCAPS